MSRFLLFLLIPLLCVGACQEAGGGGDAAASDAAGSAPGPSERVLRLLTRFEYDNTVRDLLGLDLKLGQTLPPEDVVGGYDNNARALRVQPLTMDKLQAAAEEIADAVVKDLPRHLSCDVAQNGEEGCARQLIETLGPRAFRRPLSQPDVSRYLGLYRTLAAAGGYAEGVRAVVSAMLQSPHFLYRTELGAPQGPGERHRLTPHEVASELSYLLWGSMPDAELLQKAGAGQLDTPAQIEAEARRLLASDKARAQLDHFLGQWLLLDRLPSAAKDEKLFPEFTADVRAAMRAETAEVFDRVVRRDRGTLSDLLLGRSSYMSDALARFYGLPPPAGPKTAAGLGRVDLPAGRGGLLTQGAILATQATPHSGSPIHRGKLVRERLLCQDLPPPPPGIVVQVPPFDPGLTTRERFAQHATSPACSSCHRLMDPIGLGFERFDGVGRYRDTEAGKPVDARGEILSAQAAGAFDGVGELQARLAGSREVQDCVARHLARFAFGVAGELEAPLAAEAAERFQRADLAIAELLVQLTRLRRFTERLPDPDVAPAPPAAEQPGADLAAPGPDLAAPPTAYAAEVRRDSDWMTGYCATVTVINRGAEAGDWWIMLTVEGTINNLWNARSAPAGAALSFSGLDYNRALQPGASTSFGFCATK